MLWFLPSSSLLDSIVPPEGPIVIVIDDEEEEDTEKAVGIESAISDTYLAPAIGPAAPALSVPAVMVFWTASIAYGYSNGVSHHDGDMDAHGQPPVIRSTHLFSSDIFFVNLAGRSVE